MLLLAAIYLCHLYGGFFFSFQKRALLPIFKRRISLQMTGYSSWVRVIYRVFQLVMIYFEVQDGQLRLTCKFKKTSSTFRRFGHLKKVTLAGFNSLWQKDCQISVKAWVFDDPIYKKGTVLVILVPGGWNHQDQEISWWKRALEVAEAIEVSEAA